MQSDDSNLPEMKANLVINTGGITADSNDIIAIGIAFLAVCGGIVAIILAVAWVFGKIPGEQALKAILGCVGGATIAGIVSALVSKKGSASV